jgi:hypothetical protein
MQSADVLDGRRGERADVVAALEHRDDRYL